MLPKITVLTCCKNYESFLPETIKHHLNLKYDGGLQFCMIDDGSTDNTWDTIGKLLPFEKETDFEGMKIREKVFDNRKTISVKLPHNVGPSEARNIGIKLTHNITDFYLIADADDWPMEKKIEKLLEPMSYHPRMAVTYADYYIRNITTGNLTYETKEPFSMEKLINECIIHSNSLVRKEALFDVFKINGFFYDPTMRTCEDWSLWLDILFSGWLFYHVPEPLTIVNTGSYNSTNSVDANIWNANWNKIRDKLKKYIKQ